MSNTKGCAASLATPSTASPAARSVESVGAENDLLLLDEVAGICRVTIDTVRHWIQIGKLRSLRPGRRRLVRRVDLDSFLAGRQ